MPPDLTHLNLSKQLNKTLLASIFSLLKAKKWRRLMSKRGHQPPYARQTRKNSCHKVPKFSRRWRPRDSLMLLIWTYFYYWPLGHANKFNKRPSVTCTDLWDKVPILVIHSMRYQVASLASARPMDSCQEQAFPLHIALLPFSGELRLRKPIEKGLSL